MGNKNTHRMSEQDQALLWECWHSGMSLQKIGTAVGISKPSVFLHLEKYGGYTPRPRQRRPDSLGVLEREEISRGLARGDSLRTIAARLDRSPSTISREVNRNGGREAYRAAQAESRAMDQARRPKACALLRSKRLRRVVIGLLKKDCKRLRNGVVSMLH